MTASTAGRVHAVSRGRSEGGRLTLKVSAVAHSTLTTAGRRVDSVGALARVTSPVQACPDLSGAVGCPTALRARSGIMCGWS